MPSKKQVTKLKRGGKSPTATWGPMGRIIKSSIENIGNIKTKGRKGKNSSTTKKYKVTSSKVK